MAGISPRNRLIDLTIKWAQKESPIRAIILQGSRAAGTQDKVSDYDLAVFCSSDELYTQSEAWLSSIGHVWICVHEKIQWKAREIPTRLVIFEGGTKVDFAFFSIKDLLDLTKASALPDEYNRGYSVLLDKDSVAGSMPQPTNKEPAAEKPMKKEFLRVIEEFWFEAYHVAVYLKRLDLWSVKFRSNAMHGFLLQIIEWHSEARDGWLQKSPPLGKRMSSWIDQPTRDALQGVFAHFDAGDSWKSLLHTIDLFRRLAKDVAERLKFNYPESMDQHISVFIKSLR